ncbi:hypothetical protein ACWDSJ_27795 [Nocardia sp. NPDC003482]
MTADVISEGTLEGLESAHPAAESGGRPAALDRVAGDQDSRSTDTLGLQPELAPDQHPEVKLIANDGGMIKPIIEICVDRFYGRCTVNSVHC